MSKIKSKKILGLSIFFLVILILFFSFYGVLSRGIRIDTFRLGGISIKQLYLKLDNKFVLDLKELDLRRALNKRNSNVSFDVEKIAKPLRYFTWGIAYFQQIKIDKIILDKDSIASISYDSKQYKLLFPSFNAIFDIQENNGKLNLDIQSLVIPQLNINIQGAIAYIPTHSEMRFNLKALVEKNTFTIRGNTDLKRLKINLKSSVLTSLDFLKTPLENIDNPALKSWLFEKVSFKQAQINNLSFKTVFTKRGFLPGIESSLEGNISIDSPEVRLFDNIDAIKAQKAIATFKNKRLELKPKGINYGQINLENSSISFKNLFSEPKIILDIKSPSFIYGAPITALLNHYEIEVPVEDIDSPIQADLHLTIDFLSDHTHHVSLDGSLETTYSNLKAYGIPLYSNATHVSFNITQDYKFIYIKTNGTYYYNMLVSDLDGVVDLKDSTFKTRIAINRLSINTNQGINFEKPFQKKDFQSHIASIVDKNTTPDNPEAPSSDSLQQENTQPDKKNTDSETNDALEAEIDDNGSIIKTSNQNSDTTDTQNSDNTDNTKTPEQNPENTKNTGNLDQRQSQAEVAFNQKIDPSNEKQQATESQNNLDAAQTNQTASEASKARETKENENTAGLDETFLKNPSEMTPLELKRLILKSIQEDEKPFTQEILSIDSAQNLTLDAEVDFKDHANILINLPDFKTSLTITPTDYIFKFNDIAKYIPYSPLIRYLDIRGGNAYVTTQDFKDFSLLFSINQVSLPLYDFNGMSIKSLDFNGMIQNDVIEISSLDRKIHFIRKDSQNQINISGYNFNLEQFFDSKIPAIHQALHGSNDGISPTKEQIKNKLDFLRYKHQYQRRHHIKTETTNIEVENMSIYYKNHIIPTDSITVRFRDQRILADATYKNGIANLDFIDGDVYIKMTNFSADFVNYVIKKNIFDGGLFTLIGAYKDSVFNGELKVQNTLFKNFAVLQNIINLIDTVPSLIIFKNPNLGVQGYQVKNGSVIFGVNKDYIGLEKIALVGESMDVDGNGVVQLNNQEMNISLTVSTIKNLSSILSKIPIFGYLILGEGGKISTNFTLNGTIENPKTSVSLAEDIVTAPFKILRRVFTPIDAIVDEIKSEMKDEEYHK